MRQTVKNIAAIKFATAEDAMWPAGAAALDDAGSGEAKTHAKETRGAKVVRGWELALWRMHRKAQRSNAGDNQPALAGLVD